VNSLINSRLVSQRELDAGLKQIVILRLSACWLPPRDGASFAGLRPAVHPVRRQMEVGHCCPWTRKTFVVGTTGA
jgi:hypothetical protein